MFRCELCDDFLPLIQLSRLCPTCYQIRTIIKCYDSISILINIKNNFLIPKSTSPSPTNEPKKKYLYNKELVNKDILKVSLEELKNK